MKNKYEIRGEITAIFLRKKDGSTKETLIDTEDLSKVDEFPNTWCEHQMYVRGTTDQYNENRKMWSMHRLIMSAPNHLVVDHINHDTLDNRKINIRVVTKGQNNQNVNTKSGVRGVTWYARSKKWLVRVVLNKKIINIGYFNNIDDAKRAAEESRARYLPYSQENYNGVVPTNFVNNIKKEASQKPYKTNKSSVPLRNITWDKKMKQWRVDVSIKKKPHYSFHHKLDDAIKRREELLNLRNTLK